MTILDRYVLFLFLKTFLVCFLSFVGLFIVIHLFSNLDELAALSKTNGGWAKLMVAFYTPRVVEMFDQLSPILVLISAIFAVNMMQKRAELTAIEAGGITKLRAIRPILIASLVIIGFTVANRETLIPKMKDRLVRTPQNWSDQGTVDMTMQLDAKTGMKIRGRDLIIEEKRINEANIQLPIEWSHDYSRIQGTWATIVPATKRRPEGLLFYAVNKPARLTEMDSIEVDGEPIVFTPKNYSWLSPEQCFVAVKLDIDEIAYGSKLAQYRTTPEMIESVRRPQNWFGENLKVGLHSRIMKPFLDFTLLLLALPVVMANSDRNIFASAGLSFLIVGGFSLVTMACQSLGTYNMIEPAALAAALPLLIFVPFAVLSLRNLK